MRGIKRANRAVTPNIARHFNDHAVGLKQITQNVIITYDRSKSSKMYHEYNE